MQFLFLGFFGFGMLMVRISVGKSRQVPPEICRPERKVPESHDSKSFPMALAMGSLESGGVCSTGTYFQYGM